MRRRFSCACGILLSAILLLLPACDDAAKLPIVGKRRSPTPTFHIAFLFDGKTKTHAAFLRGAEMAAIEAGDEPVLGKAVDIVGGDLNGPILAGRVDEEDFLGALTIGGRTSIRAAADALDSSSFAVFELSDDLYETGDLRSSVFQMPPAHSWEAWRLARYFGPGDRGYRKVALVRGPGVAGEIASATLAFALTERSVEFADLAASSGTAAPELAQTSGADAVVLEGDEEFLQPALDAFEKEPVKYMGRSQIRNGYRPQIAGFSSMISVDPPHTPGVVTVADYAWPLANASVIDEVGKFIERFEKRYGSPPRGPEVLGYDAVRLIAGAARSAGSADRLKMLENLESLDGARFSHLPISFGPDDHVAGERDVLGLWAAPAGKPPRPSGAWVQLMRTFTSDLERTNILEIDWQYFFEGARPGGEAPFFHQSRVGITSPKDDDLN